MTVLSGLLLDFLRNARPTISYSVKGAVDIDLGDHRHVGAYVVSVLNKSKRVVKELTCHVEAGRAKLRNGGVAASPGLQMDIQESDTCLSVSIPYLKTDERLEMTIVAEGFYIPTMPEVAIRSPHDIRIVAEGSIRRVPPTGTVAPSASGLTLSLCGNSAQAFDKAQREAIALDDFKRARHGLSMPQRLGGYHEVSVGQCTALETRNSWTMGSCLLFSAIIDLF